MRSNHSRRILNIGAALAALSLVPVALAAQQGQADSARGGHASHHGAAVQGGAMMGSGMMGNGMMSSGMMGNGMTSSGMMGDGMMSGGMMSGGMMQGSMMGGMLGMLTPAAMHDAVAFQPQRVLVLRDTLALTPRQVEQIEALAPENYSAAHEAWQADSRALESALTTEHPDTATVRSAAEKVLRARADWQATQITRAAAVRAVLTDTQRDALLQIGHHGGGGMMGGSDAMGHHGGNRQ